MELGADEVPLFPGTLQSMAGFGHPQHSSSINKHFLASDQPFYSQGEPSLASAIPRARSFQEAFLPPAPVPCRGPASHPAPHSGIQSSRRTRPDLQFAFHSLIQCGCPRCSENICALFPCCPRSWCRYFWPLPAAYKWFIASSRP